MKYCEVCFDSVKSVPSDIGLGLLPTKRIHQMMLAAGLVDDVGGRIGRAC